MPPPSITSLAAFGCWALAAICSSSGSAVLVAGQEAPTTPSAVGDPIVVLGEEPRLDASLLVPPQPLLRGSVPADATPALQTTDRSIIFPTLAETLEMAKLSELVYEFKDQDETYCQSFSSHTAPGLHCHWYFHDAQLGTQVMIVSNSRLQYLAVVFAGTDDLRTSLEDMHIAKKPFGNNSTIHLENHPDIKVHAGFDNAVFSGVYGQISKRLKRLQRQHPFYRKLYTTGHSLGAANSILTATALALQQSGPVVSINFGCPRTGNAEWKDYLNSTSVLNPRLGVWRVVLGWDLVPRLPEFFEHVGHTIQLWSEEHEKYNKESTDLVECYYRHYGDADLGYAGVPLGWNAKPYAWMPASISLHRMSRYIEYLELLSEQQLWVDSFQKTSITPIGYDDDKYDEPPDDWYAMDSEYQYETSTTMTYQ